MSGLDSVKTKSIQLSNPLLEVLESAAGFYIGILKNGVPYSRESTYFKTSQEAQLALDMNDWCKADFDY